MPQAEKPIEPDMSPEESDLTSDESMKSEFSDTNPVEDAPAQEPLSPQELKVAQAINESQRSPNFMTPISIVIAGMIIAGAIVYTDQNEEPARPTTPTPVANNGDNAPQEAVRVSVSVDDDPVMGNPDAPVTIIEFSDFQCPFCSRFVLQTLPELEKNYIETGKAKLIYRDFPLTSIHQYAEKAAEAAECADDQGKFWEMHDMIFAKQSAIMVEDLKTYAAELGLNVATFNDCLDSGKYTDEVNKDMADAQAAGVTGTPTFFIDGVKIVGAQPYQVIAATIEQRLKAQE